MEEYQCPGLSLALALGEDVVYAKGYGRRNEGGDAVTTNTIFGIASITKAFTALAIAQLYEAGKLGLDDSVKKYLPSFKTPEHTDAIKIIHLINHTSGLPLLPSMKYAMMTGTARDTDQQLPSGITPVETTQDLLRFMGEAEYEMLGYPGHFINYSNDGYSILGAIVESVSGMSYSNYIEKHILKPLGMTRTMVERTELVKHSDVTDLYYHDDDNRVQHTSHWQEAPSHFACGWLRSCSTDLVKFWQMLEQEGVYRGTRVLSSSIWRELLSRKANITIHREYGPGVRIQPNYRGETVIDHTGGLRGISSNAGFVKDKGITVAVLSNLSGFPSSLVFTAAVNLMLSLPLDTPRYQYARVHWPEEVMSRRTGVFMSSEGFTAPITITSEGGKLLMAKSGDIQELTPTTADVAVLNIVGQDMSREVRFHEDDSGQVWAIGNNNRMFRRV